MDIAGDMPQTASETDLVQICKFNETAREFPDSLTLNELIESQVEKYPESIAIFGENDRIFGVSSFTYRQLNEKANQLAHRLRAEGVRPGHVVALLVERSFAMTIGVLGILKAGATYLPLSPENPSDRVEYMLKDAKVDVLLVQNKTANSKAFVGRAINLEDMAVYKGPTTNPVILNTPQDLAYVIYTSGSTGKPKGVMVEHRSVINNLYWMQRAYPIGSRDVILQKTPYFFDVSVFELFWWVLGCGRLALLPAGVDGNPAAIVDSIDTHQISVLHFVPSMLNVFLEYLNGKGRAVIGRLTSVRRVFASGEALAPGHVKRFNDIWGRLTGAELTNLYGPTEATVHTSYFNCPRHNDFAIVPIGRPIDNSKFYVVRNGCQVAIGESGELCIAGVGLARGYLNNAALTEEKFTDNPACPGEKIYRTGDVVRWLPDGNVEYLGREDHQVKIRGFRIELGEIENSIREFPAITDCVAVVKTYSESVSLIVAYLIYKDGLEIKSLEAYLKSRLPGYMVPNHFQRILELPLTPSGKADRKALPEPDILVRSRSAEAEAGAYQSLKDASELLSTQEKERRSLSFGADGPTAADAITANSYLAPRNDLEISLARVCERVLGVQRVGITDNFFELGAHSLTLITLTMEMEKSTGLDINLGELFRSPTIAELVISLGASANKNASIVVPLQPDGNEVPIFCICGIDVYKDFAQSLGKDQPVFGVYVDEERAIVDNVLRGETRGISIERLVDSYYSAISRFRPKGPYRLAGLSFGGILALSLANKMRERGDKVDFVFLFDTLLPESRRRLWARWIYRQLVSFGTAQRYRKFRELYSRLGRTIVTSDANTTRISDAGNYKRFVDRQDAAFLEASRNWQPRSSSVDFPVILFRALDHAAVKQGFEFSEDYGWRRYLGERLVVANVTGDHLSHIKAPNVLELAQQARRFLGSDPVDVR